jgi:hypothetical protein
VQSPGSFAVAGRQARRAVPHFGLNQDDSAMVVADLAKNTVTWFRRQALEGEWQLIGEVDLPTHLTGKELFFTITLKHNGDTVAIITK